MHDKIEYSKELIKKSLNEQGNLFSAVACSFGKDSMAVLHLAHSINPDIKVFSVMTRYKPEITLAFKEYVTNLWNLNIKTYTSNVDIQSNLYETNPDECCRILKVEPTKQAINDLKLKMWITGLRRTEGETRENFSEVEYYEDNLIKLNPILEWSEADVWKYTAQHSIPANPLYYRGYRSLGCAPCSKPYTETERGGRWQGTSKCGGECGIHTKMYKRVT